MFLLLQLMQQFALYFCLFVCFCAFVVCVFLTKIGVVLLSRENLSVYKPSMQNIKKVRYGIIVSLFEVTSKRGINIYMVYVVA